MIIRLQTENVATHWSCCICGGSTATHMVYAVAFRDDGREIGHVCDDCVRGGREHMLEQLAENVAGLRAAADATERLAGELEAVAIPSFADWEAAEDRFAQFVMDTISEEEMNLPDVHSPLTLPDGSTVPVVLG